MPPRAPCITLRASATPEETAESCTSWPPTASASRCARVVLPVPAGPHRMSDGRCPPSSSCVSALPGPSRCDCPTYSSNVRGRIRAARGASTILRAYRRTRARPLRPRVPDDAIRADPVQDADLARDAVPRLVVVPPRERVDVPFRLLAGDAVEDGSSDRDPAVPVAVLDHADRRARIAPEVEVLGPSLGCVQQDVVLVGVHPKHGHLRASVRVQRDELGVVPATKQLAILTGQRGHRSSSSSSCRYSARSLAGEIELSWIGARCGWSVTRRPRSRSCASVARAGAPVSGSWPDCALGNAVTSRSDSTPVSSMTILSSP